MDKKHVSLNNKMHCRPTFYNYLPRREGILLAKVRTNQWTFCNWYLKKIGQRKCRDCVNNPMCISCEACEICGKRDDTGHVLNDCGMHDRSRYLMLKKIGYNTGKVTDLITSNEEVIIKELGRYLVAAEDTRKHAEDPKQARLKGLEDTTIQAPGTPNT